MICSWKPPIPFTKDSSLICLDHSRMIIIPEGKLSYFPFDILVTEPVPEFSGLYKDVPFLIRDCSIRYGYSATLLDRLEKTGRIRLDKLIAFAPGYAMILHQVASGGTCGILPLTGAASGPFRAASGKWRRSVNCQGAALLQAILQLRRSFQATGRGEPYYPPGNTCIPG